MRAPAMLAVLAVVSATTAAATPQQRRGVAPAADAVAPPGPPAPAAPYRNRSLRALTAARGTDEKCGLVLEWASRATLEYPGEPGSSMTVRQGIGIYRDEDFSQVFGQRFDDTTPKWRADLYDDVIEKCYRLRQPAPGGGDIGQRMLAFRSVLDGPWSGRGELAAAEVARAVRLARDARRFLDDRLATMAAGPSVAAFEGLGRMLETAEVEIRDLWPSERRHLADEVAARRRSIASTQIAATLARPAGSTIADAARLDGEWATLSPLLEALTPADAATAGRRHAERLDAIVAPILEGQRARLLALPATIEGARDALAWRGALAAQLGPFARGPVYERLLALYGETRQRLLTAALPGWQATLAEAPTTDETIAAQRARLDGLFAPDERRSALHGSFSAALDGLVERKRSADAAAAADAAADSARLASEAAAEAEAAEARALAAARKAAPGALRRCDAAAAHPDDAAVTGAGVRDDAIRPPTAIAECLAATLQNPTSARAKFQLGRAYWAAERYDDAVDAMLEAETLGYAPAYFYLALAHELGRIDGEAANLETAADFYLLAAAEGFRPAVEAYQGLEFGSAVEFGEFLEPAFARAVYEQAFDGVRPSRDTFIWYLVGVQEFLELTPEEFEGACPGIVNAQTGEQLRGLARTTVGLSRQSGNAANDVAAFLQQAMSGNPFEAAARMERLASFKQRGMDDFDRLVADGGGCESEAVARFYGNVRAYAAAQ
jgi:hypothetical protein